jgi:hypothetical protein
MSAVDSTCVWLLIGAVGLAALSAMAVARSAQEGDVGSAWGWAAIFLGASLVGAWCFWRLV